MVEKTCTECQQQYMPTSNRQQVCSECKAVADTLGPPVTVGEPGPEYVMPKSGYAAGGLVPKPAAAVRVIAAQTPRTLEEMARAVLELTGCTDLILNFEGINVRIINELRKR